MARLDCDIQDSLMAPLQVRGGQGAGVLSHLVGQARSQYLRDGRRQQHPLACGCTFPSLSRTRCCRQRCQGEPSEGRM